MKLMFEQVNELLRYEPETGRLFWRVDRYRKKTNGKEAGCEYKSKSRAYIAVRIGGRLYGAHMLAWLLNHAAWPTKEIDHIDGNGINNRMDNLRDVTRSDNMKNRSLSRNSTTGVTGVHYHKSSGKYRARIYISKRNVHLGYFHTIEDAELDRKKANAENGFSLTHGRHPVLQQRIETGDSNG